ncbi:phage minor structural protein, N-terminal domain protein [Bifidobacterium adolescentis L2-32]|uniref:Phage minor structural protein, N-terminal domain protein n=2 Tax=Bifidobacterium adolescentis TaxID=1680 RepID=A7A6Z0_BIFAD|nr:phage minor structural protein, N-terminal domain protein [Bifidobacterium adolescentis L2-32]
MRYMIFDRWGNPLGDLPYAIKAIRTRATDGTDTLDITTIGEINKDERIAFKDSMGLWAEYLCQSTQTARAAGMPVTVAYCTGSIAELSRTYIEDKRNRNANAKACLAKALEGTRWAVGTVETGTITGTANLSFYHCTALDAIQKTADTYGLEVQTEYQPDPTGNQIGRRIIHLVEHRGTANTTKRFEYGKDLTQIKRDIDSGDVITRLYGWGKGIEQTNDQGEATGGYSRKISFADVNNGKPYVQDDQALANWGIVGADGTRHHSEAAVDFPDCEDPKELLTLTKNALKTRATPVVSYTADVTALGQAGLSAEGADVGDSVQIIDTSFATPLRLEGRILQIEEDLAGSLADTKITLGNIRQSYTQRLAAQQQALDKLVSNSGAWNSAAGGTGPYMKDLIDRINQIMNATGGYTYLKPGQGIYVYDKPEDQNPTQCIHIGGGYWRIADHKKANGDWDFRSLANGKGLFADTIFTGRLSDAAGLNHWDMDTGEFSLSARSTVGGKTVQEYADGALSDANSYTDAAKQAAITEAKRQADAADTAKLAEAKKYAEAKAGEAETAAKAQSKADGEAAKAAAQAYVDALDESLGQRSIFDRLTNNGQTQGIYLSGGLLYLNATYMRTGVLDAALVKAGRLTDKKGLNFWDMDTGEFSLSASSTVGGNKASSLATQTQAQKLATNAQTAAKAYADSVGTSTLNSARNDATTKADTALSGAKTYAETIMAYGSNLVRNPNGNPDHDLDKLGASKLTKTMPAAHPEGITSAIRLGNVRDTYFGWSFDSFRGHTFRLSGWAYRKAGNVTSSFGIHWMDASGSNHWQTIAKAAATASGWTYVSGSYTVPSNAKTARLWMQVDRDTTTASDADWYWTGLQCTDETAARSYVDTFEGELTQTYIFNKLTDNGQKQGLYLSNGLLYVNATYMRTGTITGKRSYWNLDTGQFAMTNSDGKETVHFDGDGANNLLTGTFQTASTGRRVKISPDFNSYEIGGTETYKGSGISFPLDGTYASSPSIFSYSNDNKNDTMSGIALLSGYRTKGTPGAFGRLWSRKYPSDTSAIESQAYFTTNTKYSDATDTDSGGSLNLYSRQAYGGEATLNAWSPSAACIAGVKATGSKAKAYATAADSNGEVGMIADISTGYLHLGGFLGGIDGRHTFLGAWWENVNGTAMKYHQFTFTAPAPAKYGSYKALATVDHRGDDWALIWSTVSDCTASGWLIWVSTGPAQVVTNVNAHWNHNTSTGVVSNLSINVDNTNLFNGTKNYYLNTIGFLKK